MDFQMLELSNINHTQFLILHHLNQCPKGLLGRFDMIKQDSCNHVKPLNIAQLNVINAVAYQHFPQHLAKQSISGECWVLGVSPMNIQVDLRQVCMSWLEHEQSFIGYRVIFLLVFRPFYLPRARITAKTARISGFSIAHTAKETDFPPVKRGFDLIVVNIFIMREDFRFCCWRQKRVNFQRLSINPPRGRTVGRRFGNTDFSFGLELIHSFYRSL